jgi:UDP-glucuronate decarboxylase
MRTVITGGAGFIGGHLTARLLAEGRDVTVIDNFHTGRRANVPPHAKLKVVEHDVAAPFDEACDEIYHLACPASPPHYQADPIKTIKTNVLGTLNALELARKNKARFFLASTSEIYGDPKEHPQRESYWGNCNPNGIRSCYDEGKRIAETLTMDFHRQHGLDVRIVRIFNTYGPQMLPDDGRVVSNFIVQALRGEPLTIYGDGSQTRSFCYVDDLVEGFVRMMRVENFTGPVNLGNPGEFTVKQLADKVLAATGSRSRIEQRPLPKDDPTRRKPDISLAKEKLDWQPRVALDDGLDKTITYFAGAIGVARVGAGS